MFWVGDPSLPSGQPAATLESQSSSGAWVQLQLQRTRMQVVDLDEERTEDLRLLVDFQPFVFWLLGSFQERLAVVGGGLWRDWSRRMGCVS